MPSAIIADDEPLLREELRELLADLWPGLEIIGEFSDGAQTLRAIEQQNPAVSFLDIRMPKLSGLEVAERVQGATQVVFVTAFDEHAIAAFDQGAADYLLKPVRAARLAATIKRLQLRLTEQATADGPDRPYLRWIQATLGRTLRFIPVHEVCYFSSDGKYTRVVTPEAAALIRRSLSALTSTLDPEMFRQINRGVVVNVEHIENITREETGAMIVHVRDCDMQLRISKSHQGRFRGM
jgi:DNA-binding LytR/AlgR family response regulator